MTELRIGVIGAGVMGAGHVEYLSHHVPGVTVTAVCDTDTERARALVERFSPEATVYADAREMVSTGDFDGVVIASPDRFHAETVRWCLERAMPVLCEKPLAETLEEAEEIDHLHQAAIAARGNRDLVHLGFMRRFDPAYTELKKIIDSGELGAALFAFASTRNVSTPGIRTDQLITNISVHEIDVYRWLFATEWESLEAHWLTPSRHASPGERDGVVLTGTLVNGVTVAADIFANNSYGYDTRTEVTFEGGVFRMDTFGRVSVTQGAVQPDQPGGAMAENWIPRFTPAYIEELRAWVAVVRGGEDKNLATITDAIRGLRALDTISGRTP